MPDEPGRVIDLAEVLNPRYTLDALVSEPFNRLALAAAQAVVAQPGAKYSPLYICGPRGLGKTHLAQAIARALLASDARARVRYCTGAQFVNELVEAVRVGTFPAFRARYRENCDALIMDDIEGLAGKERGQVELFEAFNLLYDRCRQIVLVGGRTPQELEGIEPRLTSRFGQGLVVDLQPPNVAERMAILRHKASAEGVELPEEVADFIAINFSESIRALEGALQRVVVQAAALQASVTLVIAAGALAGVLRRREEALSAKAVLRAVASYFSLKVTDLRGPKRYRTITRPRQIAMYLIRKLCGLSYPEIGAYFGGKDHSTVIAACRRTAERMETDAVVGRAVEQLERALQAGLEANGNGDGQAA